MTKQYSRANPSVSEVVIAFQPRVYGASRHGIEPGRVALFRLGDPRVHLFDCFDGACWEGWRSNPDRQVGWMLNLKRDLIAECGVSKHHVEGVFRQCPEYRAYRVEQRRLRDARNKQKRRISVRTR